MRGWTNITATLDVTSWNSGCATDLAIHQFVACNSADKVEHFCHVTENYCKTDLYRICDSLSGGYEEHYCCFTCIPRYNENLPDDILIILPLNSVICGMISLEERANHAK
jgi:hypothetical protein